jgi:signal transduction histidine kinase
MAEQDPDPRLGIIVEQADRLSRLVAQLLTVSKLEAGTLQAEIDVFPLGPLVQRVWESLGRTDHAFRLQDDATGWLAAADRDWVEQIAWALLDNALKYGGSGTVEVSVAIAAAEPSPAHGDGAAVGDGAARGDDGAARGHVATQDRAPRLVATFRDHGPGIAADHRERVFERFARLHTGGGDGTGLGLSVARGLAVGTGGSLEVVDPPGGGPGAAFALALPAERIEEV